MEKTAVNVRLYFIISSMLVLAASAAGCGGSGGDRPVTGGTAGTPETISTGGTTGTPATIPSGGATSAPATTAPPAGGTTVTGGATAAAGTTAAGLACTPGVSPAKPLLTDFSTSAAGWHVAAGKWGTVGNLTGSVFSYARSDAVSVSTMTSKVDTVAENLQLSGNVMAPAGYGGGGMSFDQCVNTSVYTGVQFTLGGTTSGCALKFELQTFDQQAIANGGGCDPNTMGCYGFPNVTLTTTTGQVVVKFADLAGSGQPATAAAIAQQILGLQWQFESPPPAGDAGQPNCMNIAFTIDDVSFVTN
jgi:hypothetical protein